MGADSGRLYISDNSGGTWAERQPAGNADKSWAGAAMSSDGRKLVAAVWPGRLYTAVAGPPVAADFDQDCDVDADDFDAFKACAAGPGLPIPPDCAGKNLDADGDVDMDDFGRFQRCYSGAGHAPAPNCSQ